MSGEHVCCALCGADDPEPISAEPAAVICKRCGLTYAEPRPTAGELEEFYREEYRRLYQGDTDPRRVRKEMDARSRSIVRTLRQVLDVRGRRVLEVGCATGQTLARIRNLGGDVEGIEPTIAYAAHARDVLGIPVHVGPYRTYSAVAPFDVIVLSHVLEHLPDPIGALETFHSWLRDGGLLYVEVPNFLSYPWLDGGHLYHFSPATLDAMLARARFVLVRVRLHSDRLGWRSLIYPEFYVGVVARAVSEARPEVVTPDWRNVMRRRDKQLHSLRRRLVRRLRR